jgi:hypothetical protein
MRRTSAILVVALTMSPALAGDGPPGGNFPGGVFDPKTKTLYAQVPGGGMEAIDVTNGKVLWKHDAFSLPLALADGRLIVQSPEKDKANAVRIHVYDSKAPGEEVLKSDPVEFPDWVNVGTAHGRSFTSRVAGVAGGKLLLVWQARAWYAGGARPTPEIEKAARKQAEGTAEVDLKSGKVAMHKEVKVEGPAPDLPKDLEGVKSAQYWTGSGWETKPFIVGNKVVALSKAPLSGKQGEALTLQTWDLKTGKADKGVPLLEGRELWLQVGADRRHLFVHQALVKDQLPAGDYAWWVYSLEDGKQVAKVPYHAGALALHFADGTVFTVTEETKLGPRGGERNRLLRSIDAATGKTVWERPLYAPPVLPPLP